MKVLSMHKVGPAMEAGELPSQELMRGMGQLLGEMRRANALVDGDGLRPSVTRARVRAAGGKVAVQKGPYGGENELVESMARIKVRDMDEAIAWTSRVAAAMGDGEVEVGPLTEGWDLGLMAKPADAPLRCLLLHKGDAASEAGQAAAPSRVAALGQVTADMAKAGVLLTPPVGLRPSREGLRISVTGGKAAFRDGPFTESKELIAGFVLLDVPSLQAAREWAIKFSAVTGDVEMELRPLREGQ
jgi:hypothetical protein